RAGKSRPCDRAFGTNADSRKYGRGFRPRGRAGAQADGRIRGSRRRAERRRELRHQRRRDGAVLSGLAARGFCCGSAVCGYGVVEGPGARYVTAGTIRCASLAPGPGRLRRIHENLLAIIDEFSPQALSLERHFVAANVQSAFRLGEARAMAMLAAAERGLAMFEYPPNEVK